MPKETKKRAAKKDTGGKRKKGKINNNFMTRLD
jgi:hypothetical protein